MHYLIVDDSPTMRRIVINALAVLGFEKVTQAENGLDALEKLSTNKIDFIITDWNMPEMNGLQLIEAIRANPKTKDIPILLVTTRGSKEDIMLALKAKVNNYVVKPFTPMVLKEKITSILNAIKIK